MKELRATKGKKTSVTSLKRGKTKGKVVSRKLKSSPSTDTNKFVQDTFDLTQIVNNSTDKCALCKVFESFCNYDSDCA